MHSFVRSSYMKVQVANDFSSFTALHCLLKTEMKVYTRNKIPLGSNVVGL